MWSNASQIFLCTGIRFLNLQVRGGAQESAFCQLLGAVETTGPVLVNDAELVVFKQGCDIV